MRQPIIKSRKQHVRLWFEFYKLCLNDPDLQESLEKSKSYYQPWGDVRNILFDPWWKDHKYLFGDDRVLEITRASNHPNSLNVSIPLNQPVTKTLKAIKDMIEEKQRLKLDELGLVPSEVKTKSIGFGKFEFTRGVEIRGRALNEILIMYSIWKELDKPPVNTEFCMEVVKRLKNRPRSNWIPYVLQNDPVIDKKGNLKYNEDQLRQIRRYLKKGEQICKSVSRGEFPGKSRLK